MKSEVDSNQKRLPYPVIMTQAILHRAKQDNIDKKEISKSLLSVESILARPNIKSYQKNNTVFVVSIGKDKTSAMVIPYNIDTKPNYIDNIISLIESLTKEGVTRGVFPGVSLEYLDVFKEVKSRIDIPMGMSQTNNVLTCIWDSNITSEKSKL